jgi:gas vesicle protein
MAHHDELPQIIIERRSGAVVPFLWGTLVGAAVALLWAPRSGRDTQRELHGAADRMSSALRSRVDEARDAVVDAADGVRQRVTERFEGVRDAVETRAEGVRQAVDSGRQAAEDARHDLEQRVAEAKREARRASTDPVAPPLEREPDVVITEIVEERPPRPDLG